MSVKEDYLKYCLYGCRTTFPEQENPIPKMQCLALEASPEGGREGKRGRAEVTESVRGTLTSLGCFPPPPPFLDLTALPFPPVPEILFIVR